MQKSKRERRVYLGNCVSVIEKKIQPESVDLVVTSPPYDDLRKYGGHSFHADLVIFSLYHAVKPGGVVVWVVGDSVKNKSETGTSFSHVRHFIETGFLLHDTMIFEKNTVSFPARKKGNRYTQIFEYMFIFSKDIPPKTANLICDKENKWAGYTNWGQQTKRKNDKLIKVKDINPVPKHSPRTNIWKYNVSGFFGNKDHDSYKHPATFPEQLAIDHISTWSKPGDVVMDPMCGSGTTGIAAIKLKRNFIGIEIEKKYYKLTKSRIHKTLIKIHQSHKIKKVNPEKSEH